MTLFALFLCVKGVCAPYQVPSTIFHNHGDCIVQASILTNQDVSQSKFSTAPDIWLECRMAHITKWERDGAAT
jgi:hypothetical protein